MNRIGHTRDDLVMMGAPPIVAWLSDCANSMLFPICWHDPTQPYPKPFTLASCFALKFPDRLIGVTAAHVVRIYQGALQQVPSLTCQLRNLCDFDLERALIDIDDDLDVATFDLTERELMLIQNGAFDCRNHWPPPEPTRGNLVSIAGFPEFLFSVDSSLRVGSRNAFGAVIPIEDLSDCEIYLAYDSRTAKGVEGIPMPPLGANLSGCSGGPVVLPVLVVRDGRPQQLGFAPVGLIVGGSNKATIEDQGESAEFDIIRVRRLNCIRPDGILERRVSTGWLPA